MRFILFLYGPKLRFMLPRTARVTAVEGNGWQFRQILYSALLAQEFLSVKQMSASLHSPLNRFIGSQRASKLIKPAKVPCFGPEDDPWIALTGKKPDSAKIGVLIFF
jgi:hypothetical protein